jgi:hypothetical protein
MKNTIGRGLDLPWDFTILILMLKIMQSA